MTVGCPRNSYRVRMVDLHDTAARDSGRAIYSGASRGGAFLEHLEQDGSGMEHARALLEQLAGAVELREAADQDCPPWVANREIRRLEHEVMEFVLASSWWRVGDMEDHLSSSRVENRSILVLPATETKIR